MPQLIEQQKEGWEEEFSKLGLRIESLDTSTKIMKIGVKNIKGQAVMMVDYDVIKSFIRSQRQSAREEVLLKAKGAIQELINISNENASNDWYDGLRAARSSIENILRDLAPQE